MEIILSPEHPLSIILSPSSNSFPRIIAQRSSGENSNDSTALENIDDPGPQHDPIDFVAESQSPELSSTSTVPENVVVIPDDNLGDSSTSKKGSNRRGRDKRRSYKASFKVDVIHAVESGGIVEEVPYNYGTSRTNVIKWMKSKQK